MTTDETLNELLVRLFKDLMEIEGRCLVNEEFKDISYNDFHIIEAIGTKEPKSMSATAKLMRVTTGTLTKAMDGLTDKGYVIRERSKQDKRVVWVYLTDKGKAAYAHHEEFHRNMIANIKSQLTEQETPVLIYALAKLVDYFQEAYGMDEEKDGGRS
jgi:DNA-binding MarR family transcriptional regulator